MLDFKVVIPARFASTRLPGKPLLDIAGQPMVIHVVQRAWASGASQVIVATDHEEIFQVVERNGYQAMMTDAHHSSGTDRLAEVAQRMAWPEQQVVVNVQGDEPLIASSLIQQVAQQLEQDDQAVMATACHAIDEPEAASNPNVVKVVMDRYQRALYFSRAAIPHARDAAHPPVLYRHMGIYAYRAGFLHQYANLPHSPMEAIESLEQLRVLWNGYAISVYLSEHAAAPGVDTEQDLAHVRKLLMK